jgi:hypothetical protein
LRERPILFSGPMVRAILEGKKTQTRRVMRPQPDIRNWRWTGERWEKYLGYPLGHDVPLGPYGAVGDRLWVRETWMAEHFPSAPGEVYYHYRADNTGAGSGWTAAKMWKPSIHMPRKASRLTLEVTDVRVEQLQSISEMDARAEGMELPADSPRNFRRVFAALWDEINGKRPGCTWADNPWVWAVTFERVPT